MFNINPFIVGKIYQLKDLNTAQRAFDSIDPRSKIKVLFIDDEDFTYLNDLRNEGFCIQQIKDIEDFESASAYPIVICDVKGVGHKFSKDKEGVYIVKELKKKYPFKQIAVYSSGNDFRLESTNELEGIARIKKDADKDMWCSYIDEMIRKAIDPKECWITIRNFLLCKGVDIKDVMLLESNFVDIYNNRPEDMKQFPEEKKFPNLTQDVRGVVQSLIAGGILHMLSL